MTTRQTRITEEDYQKLTASNLRSQLKKRKLSTNGKKEELIGRLLQSDKKKKDMTKSVVPKHSSVANSKNSPEKKNVNGGSVSKKKIEKQKEMERKEREKIVLWRSPFTTMHNFVMEAGVLLYLLALRLYARKKLVLGCLLLCVILTVMYHIDGPHQASVGWMRKYFLWSAYWVGLGILSSVGLGTGLHTFLLYLGPHIAGVTLAAYECESINFPEPPYPNEILCPEGGESMAISMWTIISKVRLEAFMWGAGTAIGELPPYFMARAARLSGTDIDDDEFEEIEELIQEKKTHPDDMSVLEKIKLSVHNLVQRVGFFGILLCASIPNPLFDLAGITCGHFLIPFWTFFGATLIGKAIIKMHIQKLFVIFLFSQHHVETLVSLIGKLPKYGPTLQTPFKDYLAAQKEKLHKGGSGTQGESSNLLAWVFEKVVMAMVAYFLLSIINSMAQSYHKRQCKKRRFQSR